jgi:hypothetical protein
LYNICRDAGNEGDGPRHGEEGRKCLRTNRTLFTEMPGMKEMAHGMAEKFDNFTCGRVDLMGEIVTRNHISIGAHFRTSS